MQEREASMAFALNPDSVDALKHRGRARYKLGNLMGAYSDALALHTKQQSPDTERVSLQTSLCQLIDSPHCGTRSQAVNGLADLLGETC